MRTIFNLLLIITIVLLCPMDVFSQKNTYIDSVETKDFSSEFLLKGEKGKIFISNYLNDSLNAATVKWCNGYLAIGKISQGKAVGKWFLFDKKNRLREYLIFGFDAKCILYSKKIDKKGEMVSEFKAITPCF